MPPRFALASDRIVTPEGLLDGFVLIENGQIVDLCNRSEAPSNCAIEDLGSLVIAPGIVDAHVHINEPGRADWEGFETGTQAAAAGGVTTIVDMPLNSTPVTIDAESLAIKRASATGKCWVDVGFYGGLVPGNPGKIPELIRDGVLGIKAFLCDSGLPDFPAATRTELEVAMPVLAAAGLPLLVHAELVNDSAPAMEDPRSFSQFVASRPGSWELAAILLLIDFVQQSLCRTHIVHLANADSMIINLINDAKRFGYPLTVETCPHYLYFSSEEIADGDPRFKCAPPIRSAANREQLRQALLNRSIDTIGSDHSPCPAWMKHLDSGNIDAAWGGISGIQFTLPVVWTAMKGYSVSFDELFRWLSTRPAHLIGLEQSKGEISIGYDADLVVWDPDAVWNVEASSIRHRSGISPYEGQTLTGLVHRTYVRGELAFAEGNLSHQPYGRLLRK